MRWAAVLSFLALAANAAPYRIIAYVRPRGDVYRISAEKLTHINYAFARVSAEGEVVLNNPEAPEYLAQLQALKARNPRLELLVSVGGWGADNFSDAALTYESREKFASSAVTLMKRFALDGIDLDWEYPGQPGPGIKFRTEDKENFTLLLKQMREQLDALGKERKRKYLLTIASTGGRYFEHTEMDKLHVYLDWFNVMTYDFFGSWTKTTGHHTGLYPKGEEFVKQHLAAGIPPDKIVLGAAFYGKEWSGMTPDNRGLGQPYEKFVGDVPFSQLPDKQGFVRYWDSAAKAPYLWNKETATLISYDDPESLREKARFVKRHHLGGIMFWEYSHDPAEVLLGTLYKNLR